MVLNRNMAVEDVLLRVPQGMVSNIKRRQRGKRRYVLQMITDNKSIVSEEFKEKNAKRFTDIDGQKKT